MEKIFNDNIKTVHFIGIGGVSMSGLSELLHKNGFIVSGSDRSMSPILSNLKKLGITIFENHDAKNITDNIDLVVYTAAIKEDNEELICAKSKNILTVSRAKLLGEIMKNYKNPICISGTHGKTTVTSMGSEILLLSKFDPTIAVGAFLKSINGYFKSGNSEHFVVESCEYCDSFLEFYPQVGVILNVEEDHLDYFKDIDQILKSFHNFSNNVYSSGFLIINNTIKYVEKITDNLKCRVITFGDSSSNYNAINISYGKFGNGSFDITLDNQIVARINLKVVGYHNILNALAAFATCDILNVGTDVIIEALENFEGANRRFQFKAIKNNISVIDDYAHHPTEIKSTIEALKNYECNKIWCVFQPHTYTRTKELLNEFSEAFYGVDNLIVLDIFAAREKDTGEIHSTDLVEKLKQNNINVIYINNFDSCVKYLLKNCIPNDLLITMGAGDVYIIGEKFISNTLSTISTIF